MDISVWNKKVNVVKIEMYQLTTRKTELDNKLKSLKRRLDVLKKENPQQLRLGI